MALNVMISYYKCVISELTRFLMGKPGTVQKFSQILLVWSSYH